MRGDEHFLQISSLQHYAYCPRQFALIHIEQVWDDNQFTAEGSVLHGRVDTGASEQRRDVRYERSVMLRSEYHRITGKADLLEVKQTGPVKYTPVEYKRGRPKVQSWDRIQLCAQALCLEEMRSTKVEEGALWYWKTRKRESVQIDRVLREETIAVIEAAHKTITAGTTPPPTPNRNLCRRCSLVHFCEPDIFLRDRTANYIKEMFAE